MKRRDFLTTGLVAAAGSAHPQVVPTSMEDRICVFTDPFDGDVGFSYGEVAKILSEAGASGPDLTVRPGGLVSPDTVEQDLPQAYAAFQDHGLTVPMISTALTRSGSEARSVLGTAARLGIPYYKIGYSRYDDMRRWKETQNEVRKHLAELVELGKEYKIHAGLHNHSGAVVGGFLWDMAQLLDPLDENWISIYLDPAHSVIEGGKNGWNFSLRQTLDRVTMVGVKDFVWERVQGQWRTRWVPLGQGMVPFDEVFAILATNPFPGPISLHLEYFEPTGPTKAARIDSSIAAVLRDVRFLQAVIRRTSPRG